MTTLLLMINTQETAVFLSEDTSNDETVSLKDNDNELSTLYSGKKFSSWETCENFIYEWAKEQGFRIVKDRVCQDNGIIRRRTFVCNHSGTYNSVSNRDTSTKKTQCPFLINTSCLKTNNPESLVTINKIVNEHNHTLNCSIIEFEDAKKFTDSMIEDVKFMTMNLN